MCTTGSRKEIQLMSEYFTATSKQAEVVLVWDVEKNERSLHSCQIAQFRNVRKNGVLIHDGLKNAQRFVASSAMREALHKIVYETIGVNEATYKQVLKNIVDIAIAVIPETTGEDS